MSRSSARGTAAPRRVRMSPEARREQLLDAAAEVVTSRGCDALTMESMGQAAGASKTLGYAYFKNIDDVMLSLYAREAERLTTALRTAVEGATGFDGQLRAGLGAYLDGMLTQGPLLTALSGGLESGRLGMREGRPFDDAISLVADLIDGEFGVGPERARAYATVFGALVTVHAELVWTGVTDREAAEEECVAFVVAGMRGVTGR